GDARESRDPYRLAQHRDGYLATGRGNRPTRTRNDRGWHGQALPQAARYLGPACDAALGRTDRLAHRDDAVGWRQLGGDIVRTWRSRVDATKEYRSGGDGCLGCDASADSGIAGSGDN